MVRRIRRLVLTALLGFAFALSVSFSAAQATSMAVQMAGMGMAGHSDCGGCPGGEKSGAKTTPCAQSCVLALSAILPDAVQVSEMEPTSPVISGQVVEWDWAAAPNPNPPRS